jgi:hypothetical protein
MKPSKPRQAANLPPLWILAEGAMANRDVSHGRPVPVLIVDSASVPAFDEVIRSHQYLAPGDVRTDWGTDEQNANIMLALKFERPIVAECAVVFKMPLHAGLVDQILIARGVYLQTGKPGDRVATTLDSPRLLAEVVDHPKFAAYWEYLYPRIIARRLREEEKLSRKEAKAIAQRFVEEWREKFGHFRMS